MEDSCRITLTIHPMLRIVCVFERAVSRMKTSKYISDGVDKAESFIRFKQVWRAYAFQVNNNNNNTLINRYYFGEHMHSKLTSCSNHSPTTHPTIP